MHTLYDQDVDIAKNSGEGGGGGGSFSTDFGVSGSQQRRGLPVGGIG